ncbi:MAG: crossover junction endodeoxyribonuclease RuvC, partial [bacterium]
MAHHRAMRILGIDPGLNTTGWGLIESASNDCAYLRHGAVRTKPADAKSHRLVILRDAVCAIAREHGATHGAIEAGFVGANPKSAMALGEARAACILGLADAGLEVVEYSPALVKSTVSGYGRGEKSQVAEMVRLQLRMTSTPTPEDAADALAVAITHWAHARLLR